MVQEEMGGGVLATSKLERHQDMRDFAKTQEPSGDSSKVVASDRLRFVIQKPAATRLHFDLRLEYEGTFKSWAVTRGPSLDPRDRRLAVEVEDHPLDYGDFEGSIPKGQYGGGTVQLWDRGLWAPEGGFEDVDKALARGELKFVMEGGRLHGGWVLVRLRRDEGSKRRNWLLINHKDAAALSEDGGPLAAEDRSIASGRSMAQIASGSGQAASPFMTTSKTAPDAIWNRHLNAHSTAAASPRPEAAGQATPNEVKDRVPKRAKGKIRSGRQASDDDLSDFIEPQLCKLLETPPAGFGWGHEINFDGYRMQLRTRNGKATLLTRKGLDWSSKFPAIVKAGAKLPDGIIDGEVVALDRTGAPDFAALQAAISEGRTEPRVFFVVDLLYAGSEDLRSLALTERKSRLEETVKGSGSIIRFVDHFTLAGDALLQSACRMNLEGIVSKRVDAPIGPVGPKAWVNPNAARAMRWSLAVGRRRATRLDRSWPASTGMGRWRTWAASARGSAATRWPN